MKNILFPSVILLSALLSAGCVSLCKAPADTRPFPIENVESDSYSYEKITHEYFIFGNDNVKPPLLLLHELPGLTPQSLRYAEELSKNFTVYVPLMFGSVNMNSTVSGTLRVLLNSDWRKRRKLNGGRRITQWLRGFVKKIENQHKNSDIKIIGMCLSGAFPLALADNPAVKAVVCAQPSLPLFSFTKMQKVSLGLGANEEKKLFERINKGDLWVFATRFENDRIAKGEKHSFMIEKFGAQLKDAEIKQVELDLINSSSPCRFKKYHSVLTAHWCNSPVNHPTNLRRKWILDFFRNPEIFAMPSL